MNLNYVQFYKKISKNKKIHLIPCQIILKKLYLYKITLIKCSYFIYLNEHRFNKYQ
jgi:hypothetical protein